MLDCKITITFKALADADAEESGKDIVDLLCQLAVAAKVQIEDPAPDVTTSDVNVKVETRTFV